MQLFSLGNIIFGDKMYDSKDIRTRVNAMRKKLGSYIIIESEIVGLALPRSEEFIICTIILLEANIPFLPIDLSLPNERMKYMLNNAKITKIIANEKCFGNNSLLQQYDMINWIKRILFVPWNCFFGIAHLHIDSCSR